MNDQQRATLEGRVRSLLEAGAFEADTEILRRRGAASLALAAVCGLNAGRQAALRRADWRPAGRDVVEVLVSPGLKFEAKSRTVPLMPTALVVVERYIGAVGIQSSDDHLLSTGTDDVALAGKRLAYAVKRLGLEIAEVCLLFRERLTARPSGGVAEFLCGVGRRSADVVFSYSAPPPGEAAARLMSERLPLARAWRQLHHVPKTRLARVS